MVNSEFLRYAYLDGDEIEVGSRQIRLTRVSVGNVYLPTGVVCAVDAFCVLGPETGFQRTVPAGHYPVELSIAQLGPDQRVAFAMVRFRGEVAPRWEMALAPDQNAQDLVDSGAGCFMDITACEELLDRQDGDSSFWDDLQEKMDESYVHTWRHANVEAGGGTGANVVAFSSGYGDGIYPSYFGLCQDGQASCLVTDFLVIGPPESEDEETAPRARRWWQFWR